MFVSRASFRIQIIVMAVLFKLCLCAPSTDASAKEAAQEKPPLIDTSHRPAAPPESAEARIALRTHRPAAILNRFTFPGNVLQGTGDLVEHWIVMYCPGWNDKCQNLLPSYELLGVQWENKLNKDVMSSRVRFAKVDCATEKALCVSLDIDDYPSVVHYRHQQRAASWHGGAPGLVRFVKEALEPPKKRRPKRSMAAQKAAEGVPAPSCADNTAPATLGAHDGGRFGPALRLVCFALMSLAAVSAAWNLISSGIRASRGSPSQPSKPAASPPGAASASQGCSRRPAVPEEWARDRRSIVL